MPQSRWTLEHGSGRAGLVRWTVFGCAEVGTKDLPPPPLLWDNGGHVDDGHTRLGSGLADAALTQHPPPLTPREFLRAINQFATTLTEMFLSNSDFELQVGGHCLSPGSGQGD